MIEGPTWAVLGIPGARELLHQHFPDLYAKVMG